MKMERITRKSKVYASISIEDRTIPKADYPDISLLQDVYSALLKKQLQDEFDKQKIGDVEDVNVYDLIFDETDDNWIIKEIKVSIVVNPYIPLEVGESYTAGGGSVFGTLLLITIIVVAVASAWSITVISVNIDKIQPLVPALSIGSLLLALLIIFFILRR